MIDCRFRLVPFVMSALLVLLGSQAWSQLSLLEKEQTAFKQAANFATPSVVQIETFAGLDSTSSDKSSISTFSGTVVDPQGWIVTSLFHIRGQAGSTTVVLPNKERVSAKVVARDHSRELALLKIETAQPLTALTPSNREEWRIGQWVIALGKSFDPSESSRSVGILSAQGRAFDKAIQIDAKVSPLNYGGPVVDLNGKVMAILTPINPNIATEGEVQQWYDSGIAFAVPIASILERLPKLMEGKDLYPGKIGIRPQSLDDFGGPITLAGVPPGSPAAKAGLRAGDIIKKVNGKSVEQMNQLRHALGPIDAEQSVEIDYERDGVNGTTRCELVKEVPTYNEPYLGFLLQPDISKGELEIGAILPGSGAQQGGLQVGHILERIDGEVIENRNKLRERIAFADFRTPLRFRVRDSKGASSDVVIQPRSLSKELPTEPPTLKVEVATKGNDLQGGPRTGIVEFPMGDVVNKAFAFVPTSYTKDVPHGLLLVLPEAGEINRKEWVDAFEPLCRDHRWILCCLTSADPKQWSIEEQELGQRVLRQCEADYEIDPRRIAVGGLGTGGTIAMICGIQNKSRVRGIWLVESKLPMASRFQQAEPLETTQWHLIGGKKEYSKFVESITKLGYPASVVENSIEVAKPQLGAITTGLQKWLRRMEAY